MKKYLLIFITLFFLYSICKKDKIYYIPIDIPGSQMATTIPPFGTFIEQRFKNNQELLRHELVHWSQFNRMGFFGFYFTYISEYMKYGRKYGPMEREARKLSRN